MIGSTGSSSAPRGERADERRWSRTEGSKLVVKAAYWSRRSRSYGESANRFEGVHGRAHVKRPIPPRSVSNPRYYRAAHKSQPAIERAPLHRERGARSISMDAAASIAVARLPPRIIRFPSPRKVGGKDCARDSNLPRKVARKETFTLSNLPLHSSWEYYQPACLVTGTYLRRPSSYFVRNLYRWLIEMGGAKSGPDGSLEKAFFLFSLSPLRTNRSAIWRLEDKDVIRNDEEDCTRDGGKCRINYYCYCCY